VNRDPVFSLQPARGWLPWGALAPVLAVLFVALPLLGVSLLLERLSLADAGGEPIGFAGLVAFLLLPFAAITLVVLAWVRFVERRALATIGLASERMCPAYLRGHALGVATAFAVVATIWAAGGFNAYGYASAFGSWAGLARIAVLLACFVVQAGAEELLFRGWLLSALGRKFNAIVAVVVTCGVFAFVHYGPGQHWLMTLNMGLFSACACCLALDSNHIWGVMGWHAGWNWLLATGFELPITGLDVGVPAMIVPLTPHGPAYLTGGADGPEGSIVCSLFFVGATVILMRRISRRRAAVR